MKKTLATLALAITATLNAGKVVQQTGPISFRMDTKSWNIDYSKSVGAHPQAAPVGWLFDFPTQPGLVGYVTQDVSGYAPVTTATTATALVANIVIDASADCAFDYHTNPDNTGNWPSSARFYIESSWSNADYVRWWATGTACLVLADGRYQYTVPMEPQYWSDTWGHNGAGSAAAIDGWNKAMSAPRRIGFTFGGGSFYGHGVWLLQGSASFNLQSINFVTAP